jgi:membrane protease YdiL (CAAX protease family)
MSFAGTRHKGLATCLALGFVFGWLTLHAGSIWPAVIAHGLYNVSLPTKFTGYPMVSQDVKFQYPGTLFIEHVSFRGASHSPGLSSRS